MDLNQPIRKYMKRNPLIIPPNLSLSEASAILTKKNKDVAIIIEEKQLRGLVTRYDIFDALKAFVFSTLFSTRDHDKLRNANVESIVKGIYKNEFMKMCGLGSEVCLTLAEGDSVEKAVRLMGATGIYTTLVMGEKGVVGTLSYSDLVKVLVG